MTDHNSPEAQITDACLGPLALLLHPKAVIEFTSDASSPKVSMPTVNIVQLGRPVTSFQINSPANA